MFRALRDGAGGREPEGGFTLIELLIVVVIIGILAAIVVTAVGSSTTNTMTASCQTDFREVQSAVEAYRVERGAYPTAVTALVSSNPGLAPTGAWLREPPYLAGHFQIVVSSDAQGTVSVYSAPASGPAQPVSSNATSISACGAV